MAAPKQIPQHSDLADLASLVARAGAHHGRGELGTAEDLYRQVLGAQPSHFDALHLCGVLMQQRGRSAEALELIGAALAANARVAAAQANYGLVLAALGRNEEALASYDRALALKPDYTEALYNRGNALAALTRFEDALTSYAQAIALRPNYPAALLNRAQLLQRLSRPHEAIGSFDLALALAPGNADTFNMRGNAHYALRSYAAALADYDRAAMLRDDAAPIHNNRGNALRELGRHQEALAAFDRALALAPDYAEAHNNRGNALLELNRIDDALADYDRALALEPDFADALVNRGNALHFLGREHDAIASFDAAIALKPQLAEAHWNRSLSLLTLGDFARGLEAYEWRWKRDSELKPRGFAQPQWRGEGLHGKTILLHAEQGYGDIIQFIRYLPMVVAKGGKVVLEIPDDLRPLIGRVDGVTAIVRRGEPLPPFDVHCPLMSLAGAFATTLDTIPAPLPYLQAPAERLQQWRARLGATQAPRVGLVWSGKPTHKNDRNRSIPLTLLAPLLRTPGVTFVSLQKEYREADRAALAAAPLVRLDHALTDFADTAAAIATLDLVIAVDTAVAHLTGSLGKPLWLLLPAIGDWRWLKERADSPWYPTARLFRQPRIGDWQSALADVSRELALFAR
jgi:tetratricopeptide (TPR) repeat protein